MSIAPRALAPTAAAFLLLAAGLSAQTGNIQSLNPSQIPVPKEGADYTVQVTATGAWAVLLPLPETWVTVTSATSGTGNGALTIHVEANTGDQRIGYVTFNGTSLNIMIGQNSATGSGGGTVQALSPTQISPPKEGGSYTITVTATGAWTSAAADSWITVAPPASGSGNGTISIQVPANSGADRTGSVFVGSLSVAVNQSGSGGGGGGTVQALSPTQISPPKEGGSYTITVTATGAWTAWTAESWITITPASGSGNGTISIQVAANTDVARGGYVHVGSLATAVSQSGGGGSTGNAQALSPSQISAPKGGGGYTIAVTAAGAWTATASGPWITIAPPASGSGNGTLSIQVGANTDVARSGRVWAGGLYTTVDQAAGGGSTVTRTVPSMLPASVAGGAYTIAVEATGAWTASTTDSWITITSGASGNGNASVGIQVAANSGSGRSGTVTIGNLFSAVVQPGADGSPPPGPAASITAEPATLTLPPEGGAATVQIMATGDWTAVPIGSNVVMAQQSGHGNGTVSFVFLPNLSGSAFKAKAINVNGVPLAEVSQDTLGPVTLDQSLVNVPHTGGSGVIHVTASGVWIANADAPLQIVSGASGTGNGAISWSMPADSTPLDKVAMLRVNSAQAQVILIAPHCGWKVIPLLNPWTPPPGGGTLAEQLVSVEVQCPWTLA